MEKPQLTFRLYQEQDYPALKQLMQLAFADIEGAYAPEEEMTMLSRLYPRGQVLCFFDDELIGANLARIVPFETYAAPHTQEECIDLERYIPEAIVGDWIYGLDIFVHPQYQNLKIGKQVYELFYRNVCEDNFKGVVGICRAVNYLAHQHEMDLETYVAKVKARELNDNVLSFHLRNGGEFVSISPEFCDHDEASGGYGVFLKFPNPDYRPDQPIFPARLAILDELLVRVR
jgi:GNAT superfamily N-acetyltransferase